jgi:hypothetical protein
MGKAEEYRNRAARVERDARRAPTPEQARQFRLVARAWRELAAELETAPESRSFGRHTST